MIGKRRNKYLLCSACFRDHGLSLTADLGGLHRTRKCQACGKVGGSKLNADAIQQVAHSFFIKGSVVRGKFGGAPRVVFNHDQTTDIALSPWLVDDVRAIEAAIGVGFFHYGPRLWMLGEITPLKRLQRASTRSAIIQRIIKEYPTTSLKKEDLFYRVRINPRNPSDPFSFDSPPKKFSRPGRLNEASFPVLYASQDLQVCLHECRVSAEDDIYVATLKSAGEMRILDLNHVLEEDGTEFDSLDIAVHMLFLSREHSYEISQTIARAAFEAGFHGIRYPSYFSLLRTGGMPFETVYGISLRRMPHLLDYERSKMVANLAIFGSPIREGRVQTHSIDRFVLSMVQYGGNFGPADV